MKEYLTRGYLAEEFGKTHRIAMEQVDAFLAEGEWREVTPMCLNLDIQNSRLEYVYPLEDEAGSLLQIFRGKDGHTMYGLLTTCCNGEIVNLLAERADKPYTRNTGTSCRGALDQALDRLKAEA